MARQLRFMILRMGDFYHLTIRTVGGDPLIGEEYQKRYLLNLIKRFSSIFFVELVSFCIMDNHYHIVMRSKSHKDYSKREVNRRISRIINNSSSSRTKRRVSELDTSEYKDLCKKLGDISSYMKYINQSYAQWYNRTHDRKGSVWGERFKSVLLERGASVLRCSAYIELNPVRANMIERPDLYQWNSLYARRYGTPISELLRYSGIYDEESLGSDLCFSLYRKYVYISGGTEKGLGKGHIRSEILDMEEKTGYNVEEFGSLNRHIRHFTDGTSVGSKEHILSTYKAFEESGRIDKKDRGAYAVSGLEGTYSLRRLKKA